MIVNSCRTGIFFMPESIKKLIGKNIRAKRKAKNISQEKLGELLNYSDESISAFERGDREPGLYTAFKMARALDCEVEDFRPNETYEPESEQLPFDY